MEGKQDGSFQDFPLERFVKMVWEMSHEGIEAKVTVIPRAEVEKQGTGETA